MSSTQSQSNITANDFLSAIINRGVEPTAKAFKLEVSETDGDRYIVEYVYPTNELKRFLVFFVFCPPLDPSYPYEYDMDLINIFLTDIFDLNDLTDENANEYSDCVGTLVNHETDTIVLKNQRFFNKIFQEAKEEIANHGSPTSLRYITDNPDLVSIYTSLPD